MRKFLLALAFVAGCTASLDPEDNDTAGQNTETNNPAEAQTLEELFGQELTCSSVSYCTNYRGNLDVVEMPAELGGIVRDGLYRAVKGANPPFGYAFYKGKYSLIRENVAVSHGSVEFENGIMERNPTVACTFEGEVEFSEQQQNTAKSFTEYAVQGDTLFTRSVCGSPDPSQCSFPTMLVKVANMCENIETSECADERCACETFTDGVIPQGPTPDNACQI